MRGKLNLDEEMRQKLILLTVGAGILVLLLFWGTGEQKKTDVERSQKEEQTAGESREETRELAEEAEEPEEERPAYEGTIRVVLKTDGFQDIFHSVFRVEADCELRLTDREETVIYGAGKEFSLTREGNSLYLNGQELADGPEAFLIQREQPEETDLIRVSSIERSCGTPSYDGNLEIWVSEKGFTLVNVVPLERYLCSVVPSEMPSSYEAEALRAQAVCARTYAFRHLQTYGYPEVFAHVDDSVRYQVYGNISRTASSDEAVVSTEGQILTWEGEPITAYYFSTSCGYTGNEDIWWEGDSGKTPYLRGKTVNEAGEELDLTSEQMFAEFLEHPLEGGFDATAEWHRWEAVVDVNTLSENCNGAVYGRYQANPEALLTKRLGEYESLPTKTLGTIRKLEVLERGESGAIQKLRITGSRKTVEAATEYNVRALLNVQGTQIMRQDGSMVDGSTLLPSACMTITPIYDEQGRLSKVQFQGGGYGHGTGMSQNGANGMAKEGKSWEEILGFFYTGTELTALQDLW